MKVKKKNIVGHMMMPDESAVSWFRRWQILPRFLCLLLAFLLWLFVVNAVGTGKGDEPPKDEPAITEEA